jgi:branched-chain amino acid transport system permease protein
MFFLDAFGDYDFLVRNSLILVLLALSIYVLMHAGMFAIPQVGFMALGAYMSAIVSTRTDIGLPVSLLLAAATGALAGLVLALALARLDGIYLAISTIAFGEIVRVTLRNLEIAGSGSPLVGIPRYLDDITLVGLLVLAVAGLARLARSRFGSAIVAIREDPLSAAHQGVPVRTYRVALFCLSGVMAACAGGMSVHLTGFVEPGLFDFGLLVDALAAVVLGGMTVVLGPLLGGLVIFGLPEFLHSFAEYRTLVNGALIILVIGLAPQGLALLPSSLLRRFNRRAPEVTSPAGARPGAAGTEEASAPASPRPHSVGDTPVLAVRGVAKHFGGIKALDGIDLALGEAEILGVIGPNGSGKTTLINVISGVYVPDRGHVELAGETLGRELGHPHHIARRGLARTFQTIRLLHDRTVEENVELGAYQQRREEDLVSSLLALPRYRRSRRRTKEQAAALLDELGLADLAGVEVGLLPYGAQRKVEIARALMSRPTVLLLDEPTAGMSPVERDEVFAMVQEVRRRGVAVVVIEHDVRAMTANCDRLAVLHFGQLILTDVPERAINSEAVIDAYIGRSA